MNCCRNYFYLLISTIFLLMINGNAVDNKKQDAKCLLPMEPGPCRMSLNRFYYNAQTDTCQEFKFGGCMGNDNKFGFKKTCEDACKISKPSEACPLSTSLTTEQPRLISKQLSSHTLKSLTGFIAVTTSTTTTTPMPRLIRTKTKSKTTTPITSDTQKSKT